MMRIIFKVVLLILAATSIIGWLIFVAGFIIFYIILSPSDAPLPATIGVSWKSVLSPMFLFGGSAVPLYILEILRIFLPSGSNKEKICSAFIMLINCFYMLGLSATLFILSLLLTGGLGDYLKNIFMLEQKHILVMATGCLLSALSNWAYLVIWPLSKIKKRESEYNYQELVQN